MAQSPKKRSPIEKWLGQSSIPVFLIGPDHSVAYFNEGCEKLTGWAAAEVIGQVCRYATSAPSVSVESLTGTICPPPEAWQGQEFQLPIYLTHRHGASLPRLMHLFPLRGPKEKIVSVLGIIGPMKSPAPVGPPSAILQLHAELAAIRGDLRRRFGDQSVVARAPSMTKVLDQTELAIQSQVQVCLIGGPGTGKEHLARMIHYAGTQKTGWFVPFECGRLNANELSGPLDRLFEIQRAGAGVGGRPQPSTVYLAEVECLPRDLQERLVQALSRMKRGEHSTWRLISSNLRPISEAVNDGKLREDLAAFLTTLTIEVPPLVERPLDLPLLAQHFLEEMNRDGKVRVSGFSSDVWPLFEQYSWPGNMDELDRVVRASVASTTDGIIRPADLPFAFRTGLQAREVPPPSSLPQLPLDEMLLRVETNAIRLALERGKDNKSKAAEILGINRARLYRRMEQLGIEDREDSTATKLPAAPEDSVIESMEDRREADK